MSTRLTLDPRAMTGQANEPRQWRLLTGNGRMIRVMRKPMECEDAPYLCILFDERGYMQRHAVGWSRCQAEAIVNQWSDGHMNTTTSDNAAGGEKLSHRTPCEHKWVTDPASYGLIYVCTRCGAERA